MFIFWRLSSQDGQFRCISINFSFDCFPGHQNCQQSKRITLQDVIDAFWIRGLFRSHLHNDVEATFEHVK